MSRTGPCIDTVADCVEAYRKSSALMRRLPVSSHPEAQAAGGKTYGAWRRHLDTLMHARVALCAMGQGEVADALFRQRMLLFQPRSPERDAALRHTNQVVLAALRAERAAQREKEANHG